MKDVIKILPDNIANQIAAGEVVQRPASVVKELMENSVDAESTEIQVFIKDAGKTLIQIVDNGKGMNFTDARLCFEKHATSKISQIDDLYNIETMGFRGEAMASIASVSRVEMKTKVPSEKLGTIVKIEGSEIKLHDHIAYEHGTSISVQSLFFNTPARRNFFKSDRAEFHQIQETFIRVALAYPEMSFSLTHNDQQIFQLHEESNFKERIQALFGSKTIEKLVSVSENTELVKINGWVSKSNALLKSKNYQYFFLNQRFIINPYLRHAVINTFNMANDSAGKPSFFINLNINPSDFDINVHPTKTEAKFKNEREIYSVLSVAVKGAVNKHALSPVIDFENIQAIDLLSKKSRIPNKTIAAPLASHGNYNPFNASSAKAQKNLKRGWDKIYETPESLPETEPFFGAKNETNIRLYPIIRLNKNLILFETEKGIVVFHETRATHAISQHRFIEKWKNNTIENESLLLKLTIELDPSKAKMLKKDGEIFKKMGFGMNIDKETVSIHSLPYFIKSLDEVKIENLIEKMIDLLVFEFGGELELYKLVFAEVKPTLKKDLLFQSDDPYEVYETFVELAKKEQIKTKGIFNVIENEKIETLLL